MIFSKVTFVVHIVALRSFATRFRISIVAAPISAAICSHWFMMYVYAAAGSMMGQVGDTCHVVMLLYAFCNNRYLAMRCCIIGSNDFRIICNNRYLAIRCCIIGSNDFRIYTT